MQFRDLHRQYEAMKAEMDAALLQTAASGAYIMGHAVDVLERQLADYVGVKHCISCANGTDALRLALMALGVGLGDAVFVPDFTFFASAEAVAMAGATPVFVDVRSDFNIDPNALEEEIVNLAQHSSLRPAAVIAVDLFGLPADYKALQAICCKHGLFLVEDGAQGFGGRIGNKRACSFALISTTSFFPAKPLGCYGDGGALFTNDDDYAAMLRSLRVHGKGVDKYDNVRIGLNSRLDTMQAAVLQIKLRHFDAELKAAACVADRYNHLLESVADRLPEIVGDRCSSWAQYTICVSRRDMVQAHLKAAGIPSMIYYPRTMSQQTAFAYLGEKPRPVAARLCNEVLALPMHPYMTADEVTRVAAAVCEAVEQSSKSIQ